jgi:enoyl-CoA hydratase/carnithine racemase
MDFDTIIYEPGRISHLTLNRLERLNAVSDQMAGEIIQAVRHFDANPEALVLVVAGSGRAFCSGADV